ncbi:hypothetical protein JY651_46615 [Pyxidicoccus parkwayensis]|uniref:Lipoprotein n=1 Tax=Pyxidicoccus parkwayensis TaxID=2813578 RepID=A0ABX7NVX6_9BACT|nr:hypothetical protein [Pyxidicoccus parkwaysis]QSQ22509.1 hypothetical protein JY651_46615 [Pyxidicoccus parkwaysis]
MKNLRWLLCTVALAVVGCGAPMEVIDEETTTTESTGAPEGQVSQAATTCTETYGECRVGRCELGANDTFQVVTTTCCTAAGACTTTRLRLCGC